MTLITESQKVVQSWSQRWFYYLHSEVKALLEGCLLIFESACCFIAD